MDTMDEKLTQAPAEAAELTDEAVDEVAGGIPMFNVVPEDKP